MKDAQNIPPALISHMGHGTVADQADFHEVSYLSEQLHAFSPDISPPPLPPSLTYHLNGCKAKGSLGPIWDHVKLLYIERLMASSFIFFLSLDIRDRGTEKPCNMSGLSSDFAGLLANWQRGPSLHKFGAIQLIMVLP